jgi:6-phospho-3-hexuloisomerase
MNNIKDIFSEIEQCLVNVTDDHVAQVSEQINTAQNIITIGAGRMGYSLKAFSMRLSHLGFKSYHLGDTNTPRTGENDLIIFGSGSGETKSVVEMANVAYASGSKIISFTHEPSSSVAKLSTLVVPLRKIESKQIMKSVYEQATYILYDKICYDIVYKYLNLDIKKIEHNHSILE